MALLDDIRVWNQIQRNSIVENYNKKGFKASGNFERELETREFISPTNIRVLMLGTNYTFFLVNGRGSTKTMTPSSPTLFDMIRKWIDDKGVVFAGKTREQTAWAITNKIHKQGYKIEGNRKGLISDAYTRESIEELLSVIRDDTFRRIQIDTLNILK